MGLPIFHLLRVLTDSQIQVLGHGVEKKPLCKNICRTGFRLFFSSNIDFPFSNYIWWTITLFKGDATLLGWGSFVKKKKGASFIDFRFLF